MDSSLQHFCILGAGIVGLSTALELKTQYPGCQITLICERSKHETTSYGAGGFLEPYNIQGTPNAKVNEWFQYSFNHFQQCEQNGVVGVHSVQAYNLYHPDAEQEEKIPFWSQIVREFHQITGEERQQLRNTLGPHIELADEGCCTYGSIIADQSHYLPWLTSHLIHTLGNVRVIELPQKLSSLHHVTQVFPPSAGCTLICNCTGFGSYYLQDVQDTALVPVRGQVVRIKKPTTCNNVAYTYSAVNDFTYVLPNHDTIVLGGTAEQNQFELVVDHEVTNRVLGNAIAFLPELKHNLQVVKAWTGRRPTRSPLRMEIEEGLGGGGGARLPPVLHLYGHGGCGVTIGIGSAHDAVVNVVKPFLEQRRRQRNSDGSRRSKI